MNGQDRRFQCKNVAMLIAALAMVVLGLRASGSSADEGKKGEIEEPIVGFWQVTFKHADGNTEYVWDAWHSDRTEIQNDSADILAGNVCQGSWVPLGHRTYGLTHPAFVFADGKHPDYGWTEDNEGQFANASCVILERIKVDKSSNNYSGPGQIKCVAAPDPFDPTAPVIFTDKIDITGKRVTVDVSLLPPA
jgi:hypothetical protein